MARRDRRAPVWARALQTTRRIYHRTRTTMGLTTAFDRLRGRRRGFGSTKPVDDEEALTQMETFATPEEVQEDEPEERLWSDADDEEEPSMQKTMLVNESDVETTREKESFESKADEMTTEALTEDELPSTTLEDNIEAAAVDEAETPVKALVSDGEDIDSDNLQNTAREVTGAEATKEAETAESDLDEEISVSLADDEDPKTEAPETKDKVTELPPISDKEDLVNDRLSSLESVRDQDDTLATGSTTIEEPSEDNLSPLESSNETKIKKLVNLDLEDVLASTEHWFDQVADKANVTVKDIVKSLCVEYDCQQLPKTIKKAVRTKLTELMEKEDTKDEDPEDEEVFGDQDDDSSADEGDAESSDDDSIANRQRGPKKLKKNIAKPSKSLTKLAKKVHAQQLKKRQLEAERVKNEELSALQSKQDEAVADAIASALEIDQDTLPQRLELLSKLDEKRLGCFRQVVPPITKKEEPLEVASPVAKNPTEDDDSSSDEDMELEIEGPRQSLGLKLVAPLRSPPKPKAKPVKNGRAALRARLVQKQRTMGNQWLARELGYQDEQEHLQDCRAAEAEKRQRIQQIEEAKAVQRARQRERLLQRVQDEDEEDEEEPVDEKYEDDALPEEDEEDEELALAKEIEQEATKLDKDGGEKEHSGAGNTALNETNHLAETQIPDSTIENQSNGIVSLESPGDLETQPSGTVDFVGSPIEKDDKDVEESQETQPETQLPNTTHPKESTSVTADYKSNNGAKAFDVNVDLQDFADADDDADDGEATAPETQLGDNEDGKTKEAMLGNHPTATSERKKPKNHAWKAILEKDKLAATRKKNSSLVEEEADEEEEEEVAGLEDFGFVVKKKKIEDEAEPDGDFNEDDLDDVVDELSDNEGDEDAGEKARKVMEKKEEKLRHKEILRRMREGYDGRRGGIAAGGVSRGLHRFEDLVAADNREDAKRLGLLNDDELDSDDEEKDPDAETKVDEEEDEAAFLDKIIKDRFLHRSTILENFEDDDEMESESKVEAEGTANEKTQEELEELEQERLAKRFSKRARMTRLVESHGERAEFSQSRLIDEDASMMAELQAMKVCEQ